MGVTAPETKRKKMEAEETVRDPAEWRAECAAAAEGQLHQDRERAWEIMGQLAVGIPKTHNNPTYQNCRRMARLLGLLQWYESRITQTEMLNTPLWCKGCAEEGQVYPGNPWMHWPCEEHNGEGLDAMGGNIYRSLFAEVAR